MTHTQQVRPQKSYWPSLSALGLVSLVIFGVLYQYTNDVGQDMPEIIVITGLPLLASAGVAVLGFGGAVVSYLVERTNRGG